MPDLREIEQDVERDRAQLSASLKALTDTVAPSRISDSVGSLAKEYPDLSFGSYPFQQNGKYGAHVVIRGNDAEAVAAALVELKAAFA